MNNQELLFTVDVLSKEKNIEKDDVFGVVEQALVSTAKMRYGMESLISVKVDRKSGNVVISREAVVVDDVKNPFLEISIDQAKLLKKDAVVGDCVIEILPPLVFGRSDASSVKSFILQKIREIERNRQYEEFKDRIGELVNVSVKRVEFGNLIVDVGRAEGVIAKEDLIFREVYRVGDRVRAIIHSIRQEGIGPLLTLSRTHPLMIAKLMAQEISEVYDGVIQIKAIARDPGSRAKVAITSHDPSLDIIGCCVGIRGSRVQIMTSELKGERIDFIPWSGDLATFIVNALAPAEVMRVIFSEEEKRVQVVVEKSNLSLAIGRKGQNVRLASILTNTHIDIITQEEDTQRRSKESEESCVLFMQALDIDEMFAQLLVTEGYQSVEEISQIGNDELSHIEGITTEIVEELKNRAQAYLVKSQKEIMKKCIAMGLSEDLAKNEAFNEDDFLRLCNNGILTTKDLADLSVEELKEFLPSKANDAADIIMRARHLISSRH